MDRVSISRRQFVGLASAYAVLQPHMSFAAASEQLRVRENINVFANNPDKVNALRLAVKIMKEKSAKNKHDPFGWDYWAAIHGTPPDEPVPENLKLIYRQCQHSWRKITAMHFLPWHRAYLFYFEAILKRSAEEGGSATALELPYWNWYADPRLPKIFTEDPENNPLWHPRAVEDFTGAFLYRRMFAFNGLVPPDATAAAAVTFSRGLEGNPHGTVHGIIAGDMGDINRSARDPIFYLHHANIDRLWTAWTQAGHRLIPQPESEWGKTGWKFDEAGDWQQTAAAMLDSSKPPLSYRYDDEVAPMMEVLVATPQVPIIIESQPFSGTIDRLKKLRGLRASPLRGEISSTSTSVKLGNKTVAVDLKLPKNESAQLSNWTERKASDIQTAALVLQDIKVLDPSKGFSFTILVSQPNAESAQPPLAVGELGPFSLSLERHEKGPGGKPSMEFPLSDFLPALKNLTSEGLERGLRVTFEPAYTPGATDLVEIGAVKVDVEARAE